MLIASSKRVRQRTPTLLGDFGDFARHL